ncbi:hypothetical protein L484_027062 [Morus notabilis]|uniref:Uncharacterized protein n=1 Tax=Morus notabilis TaxID=981085 RepID=W9S0X4_9ROSA|nr:hypothetical protein L484_027062 [Morus notabilis]
MIQQALYYNNNHQFSFKGKELLKLLLVAIVEDGEEAALHVSAFARVARVLHDVPSANPLEFCST